MRILVALTATLIAMATTGCTPATTTPPSGDTSPPAAEQPAPPASAPEETEQPEGIYAIELTDVVSGETFTLADLKGKPILLHPFAMW